MCQALGNVTEGMKIPVRVGFSMRHFDKTTARPCRLEGKASFRHRLPIGHDRHMDQRFDGLTGNGIRPFEEDVELYRPKGLS